MSDTTNFEQGDWVYFLKEYDAGNVTIPAECGGRINNDRADDEMRVAYGYQQIEIDLDGRYYEIEVPESVIELQ